MRAFVISDIHGDFVQFNSLLDQIKLQKQDKLFLLGDYIDRGEDSKEVLDLIMQLIENGFDVTCLKGNHEAMLISALDDPEYRYNWVKNGGEKTLGSFLTSSIYRIPEKYIHFIERLPYYAEYENFLFVHAGLNMKIADPFSDLSAMLWLRDWKEKFDPDWLGNRILIHGHTPASFTFLNSDENLKGQVINIDNGSFRKEQEGYGRLFALDLQSRSFV